MVNTTDSYQAKIEAYGHEELLEMWQAIKDGTVPAKYPDWPSGKVFEYLILRAFQLEDAKVTYPYTVQVSDMTPYSSSNENQVIEQIDGVIYSDGLACIVESKDWEKKVDVEPIAKIRNQLLRRHASTIGIVFSSRSGFTNPASVLAQYLSPQMVLLWDSVNIDYALKQKCMRQSLLKKYRVCLEKGTPDYDSRPEEAKTL